ncbi:MAG: tetratricopeptide repeat protein [Burkholderiaceae bacterium]
MKKRAPSRAAPTPPGRHAPVPPRRVPGEIAEQPAGAAHVFGRAQAGRPAWVVDGDELFRDGVRLAREGRLADAVRKFDDLLRLAPDHADALNDRGNALDLLRRRGEALESYERALRARPDHVHALNGRANMLQAMGRQGEAIAGYDAALAIEPRYVHAWNGRGNALLALNRHEDALACYRRALALQPAHPDANFNEGLASLALGDFETGWRQHEHRWSLPSWRARRRGFAQPLWLGAPDPRGKVVLLHAEQGFGDTLQFARFVPRVAALGARVVLEVQPALRRLLAQLPGVETLCARGDALPAFELHCPLLSLPLALGTALDTIPPPEPPLRAAPEDVRRWDELLGPRDGRPRVGIAWQGNAGHDNDRARSIPFERFAALLDTACDFVSLQPQVSARDAPALAACARVRRFDDRLRDFADTAALVSHLDLVVAVDTSVVHLAGAMGRPAWVLLPWAADWRWLTGRADSPWYPHARLWRQPREGAWDEVLADAARALAALAGSGRARR